MMSNTALNTVYRLLLLLAWPLNSLAMPIQQELTVHFDLAAAQIEVQATLTVGEQRCFTLHSGLQARLDGQVLLGMAVDGGRMRYCLPAVGDRFTLDYGGHIRQPVLPVHGGIPPISPYGVYLDPSSGWYPEFSGERFTMRLTVHLPPEWRSISQGRRLERRLDETQIQIRETWQETQAQIGGYLIATAFHEYTETHSDGVQLLALLREADPALAARYLRATAEYLDLYSALIAPYPYSKFALVENFWETGYGMPSFTLLGPRVLRLPFILHSSYPHEILHNWWGNSVYIDPAQGNWSEGLTTYLADYLLQEQGGHGRDYRRNALQRYRNTVSPEQAVPLNQFLTRHDALSQANGYDKSMMVFHTLRRQLGDDVFIAGLRHFYASQQFQRARFDDLRQSFSTVSGVDLQAEFQQWLERPDLPALALDEVSMQPAGDVWQVQFSLMQTQTDPPYQLQVPVAVQLAGETTAWETTLLFNQRHQMFELTLPQRPERLAIDPDFDLPRRLAATETAPVLSQLLGSRALLIVLPRNAAEHYRWFAARWSVRNTVNVVFDDDIAELPTDSDSWVVGWDNRWREQVLAALADQDQPVKVDDQGLHLETRHYPVDTTSLLLMARHPHNPERAVALLFGEESDGFIAMSNKLRHYGRYSYLAFTGTTADISTRGQWAVYDSPLQRRFSATAPPWTPAARAPLWPRAH